MLFRSTIPEFGSKKCRPRIVRNDAQLRDSTRALQVTGHQDRGVTLVDKPFGKFSRQGRLTRALKTGEHDDGGSRFRKRQAPRLTPQNVDEFFIDDGDHLLGRVEGFVDIIRERPLANPRGEVFDNLECHVGFQEGATNVAHRSIDISGGELALLAKGRKGIL